MSYGHAYLTSYGWTGAGTGLRKDAISKPLAIPPKKNLNGLGKDRDEAFPFWDHLFTAASKAITIKVSVDDDDDPESPAPQAAPAPTSVSLRRTTTGIISNRRPVSGTPASTSGSTTPNPNPNTGTDDTHDDDNTGTVGRLSLMATAKREAARCSLYARFFRGPVLGPNDNPRAPGVNAALHSASISVNSSSVSTPVPDRAGTQDDDNITRETKKGEKRKPGDREETREERRERKRLKKERKAVRAAKKVEKAGKAKRKKKRSGDVEQQDEEVPSEENETCSQSKKARKRARKPTVVLKGEQEDAARRSPSDVDTADSLNVLPKTKKKKAKRKDTSQ